MRTRHACPILALLLALALPARAQERRQLPAGATVRLVWRDSSARYVGVVRAVLDDTLVVADSADAPELLVPLSRLRSVEIFRGEGRGWAFTAIGLLGGAAGSAWLGYHFWRPSWGTDGDEEEGVVNALVNVVLRAGPTATGVMCGFFGGLLFGAMGLSIDQRDRWERIRPESLRFAVVPLPSGRVGLGASFSF